MFWIIGWTTGSKWGLTTIWDMNSLSSMMDKLQSSVIFFSLILIDKANLFNLCPWQSWQVFSIKYSLKLFLVFFNKLSLLFFLSHVIKPGYFKIFELDCFERSKSVRFP